MNAHAPMVIHQYAMPDIEKMARAFAMSKLFGVTTPEQALALCLVAQAEGRHPASAANDYHIVSGRPSKKAEAMLRDFLSAGGSVKWHVLDDTQADATFSHAAGGSVRIKWDLARMMQAKINNPMWQKYPRQMLRSRCVSEGVRTVYPAATSGMYEPNEVRDFSPPEPDALRDVTPPKTGKAAKAQAALEAARATADADEADIAPGADLPPTRPTDAATTDHTPETWAAAFEADIAAIPDDLPWQDAERRLAAWARHPLFPAFKAIDDNRAGEIGAKARKRVNELKAVEGAF